MSHTVIGIFTDSGKAHEAVEYLTANAFDRENIDIRTSQAAAIDTSVDAGSEVDDPIGDFFRGIFGSSVSEASRYTEAGRNGTIVTVHAAGGEQADVAARILDNYGAADVDEHTDRTARTEDESKLRSRVFDRRVDEGMRLREDDLTVERRNAGRSATDADVDAFNKNAL